MAKKKPFLLTARTGQGRSCSCTFAPAGDRKSRMSWCNPWYCTHPGNTKSPPRNATRASGLPKIASTTSVVAGGSIKSAHSAAQPNWNGARAKLYRCEPRFPSRSGSFTTISPTTWIAARRTRARRSGESTPFTTTRPSRWNRRAASSAKPGWLGSSARCNAQFRFSGER